MKDDLSRAVDAIPDLVWTAGPDGTGDFLNQQWRDHTGTSLPDACRVLPASPRGPIPKYDVLSSLAGACFWRGSVVGHEKTAVENDLNRVVPALRGSVSMAGVTLDSAQEFRMEVST